MTTYPANFETLQGSRRLTGQLDFTDSTNQPLSSSTIGATGAAIVRGPFAFAFNTASINNGVTFYTPTIGDILLDGWVEVTTAFDGTTPWADFGSFVGSNRGVWGYTWGATDKGYELDVAGNSTDLPGFFVGPGGSSTAQTLALVPYYAKLSEFGAVPSRFTTANPLKLVVSQTGQKGGAAVGGTAGAANLYIVTATPVAF